MESIMEIPAIEITNDKSERQRVSSADSSTPTVVEGQLDGNDAPRDLGKVPTCRGK